MSSVLGGIGPRERAERMGPEKVMAVLGVQEWFKRAACVQTQRPRGSKVGVVKVRLFMRTRDVTDWMKPRGSLLLE